MSQKHSCFKNNQYKHKDIRQDLRKWGSSNNPMEARYKLIGTIQWT